MIVRRTRVVYELYFKDLFSIVTLGLVLGMTVLMMFIILNRKKITKWGRLTALFIISGIAVSAVSAMRDQFAAPQAVFALTSFQATICSVAGGLIILIGLVSIFFKNQNIKKSMLMTLFALFLIQVFTVEISRPIIMM